MKKRVVLFFAIILLIITAVLLTHTNRLGTTEYRYISRKVPAAFQGYRIAQIADLHNDDLGDPTILLHALQEAKPDLIVITGDMIDARKTDVKTALDFAAQFVQIAPTYYINGNHEWVAAYAALKQGLKDRGVTVLEDASVRVEKDGAFFHLAGVVDPFLADRLLTDRLADTLPQDGVLTILLSHRPERLEEIGRAHV